MEILKEISDDIDFNQVFNILLDKYYSLSYETKEELPVTESTNVTLNLEEVEQEEVSDYVQETADRLQADLFWLQGSRNRVAFADLDLDGSPELLVTNLDVAASDTEMTVYPTIAYNISDLDNIKIYTEFLDGEWSLLNLYTSPTLHWGIIIDDTYYTFNEMGIHKEMYIDYDENQKAKFYMEDEEITNQQYINRLEEYFNGDSVIKDKENDIVYCLDYITEENTDIISYYIKEALNKVK